MLLTSLCVVELVTQGTSTVPPTYRALAKSPVVWMVKVVVDGEGGCGW